MAKARGRSRTGKKGKGAEGSPKKKAALPVRKPVKIEHAVPAICSECFGDFNLSTTPSGDRITCPSCGHVGLFDEETFAEVGQKRQTHKTNFIIALAVNLLALAGVLIWAYLNTPLGGVVEASSRAGIMNIASDDNLNMIALGMTLVFVIAGFIMTAKYEKSRVEIYF